MLELKAKLLSDLIDHLDKMPMNDEEKDDDESDMPSINIHIDNSREDESKESPQEEAMEMEDGNDGEPHEGSGLDPLIKSYPKSMAAMQREVKPKLITRFKTLA